MKKEIIICDQCGKRIAITPVNQNITCPSCQMTYIVEIKQ